MFGFNFSLPKYIIFFILLTLCCSQDEEDITAVTAIEDLDVVTCNKTRRGCCNQYFFGVESEMSNCMSLHKNKLPEKGCNPIKILNFVTCTVECQYKLRNYLGKGDEVNMEMVRADAEILYAERPKEIAFHIEMFEFCRKEGAKTYAMIKMNPIGRILFGGGCRAYFTFVYLCNAEYHKKHGCPYYRWEGAEDTTAEQQCLDAKNKCYQIDGYAVKKIYGMYAYTKLPA